MNTFKTISSELKSYFSTNAVFKILLPIDVLFVFGGLAILILNKINFILGAGFFYTIGFYGLAFGIVLAFANFRLMYMYVGFLGSALLFLIDFIWYGIKTGYWSFYTIVTCLIGAALGYFVFKKSTVESESNT